MLFSKPWTPYTSPGLKTYLLSPISSAFSLASHAFITLYVVFQLFLNIRLFSLLRKGEEKKPRRPSILFWLTRSKWGHATINGNPSQSKQRVPVALTDNWFLPSLFSVAFRPFAFPCSSLAPSPFPSPSPPHLLPGLGWDPILLYTICFFLWCCMKEKPPLAKIKHLCMKRSKLCLCLCDEQKSPGSGTPCWRSRK